MLRWILGGSPELLRALAEDIRRDPTMRLISVVGPPSAPRRLVAEMTAQQADFFRQAHNGQVIIELDAELDQGMQPFI